MNEFWLVALGIALGAVAVVLVSRANRSDPAPAVPPGPSESELALRMELVRSLEVQAAHIQRLADGAATRDGQAERLRDELARASASLRELTVREQERERRQVEDSEAIRRLMVVMAGGGSKGRAGENVLHEQMAHLPGGMLETDFQIGGKTVEFALKLPDGRRLPIDAKWSADADLERFEAAEDEAELRDLRRRIDAEVEKRANEVAKYIDHTVTAPVAIAVVPDAAYAAVRRAPARAFEKGVVIVPMSTALPTALSLYALIQRYGDAGEARTRLSQVSAVLKAMDDVLEKKLVRAATMIANGTSEFRVHLGKARASAEGAVADDATTAPASGFGESDDDDDPGLLRLVP